MSKPLPSDFLQIDEYALEKEWIRQANLYFAAARFVPVSTAPASLRPDKSTFTNETHDNESPLVTRASIPPSNAALSSVCSQQRSDEWTALA